MKNKILVSVLLALFTLPCIANIGMLISGNPQASGGGGSYLINDPLVYASDAAMTSGGWTTTGGSVANSTTSPAPMSGKASSADWFWGEYSNRSFASQTFVGVRTRLVFAAVTTGDKFLTLQDASNNQLVVCSINATDIHITFAGLGGDIPYTAGTEYYFWIGANTTTGALEAYLSTTSTKGTADLSWTGTGTAALTKIELGAANNFRCIANDLFLGTTLPGDGAL